MSNPRYAYRLGWRSLRRVVGSKNMTPAQAKIWADALGPAFHHFNINTRARAAAAVAQLAHESAGFRATTEFASGAAYEGRHDLGNTHPGDGRRFKGRSLIMITGRSNYAAVSHALHHDFVAHPTDLAQPRWAALAACWWWHEHRCNAFADRGDFIGLTRRINGGLNGLDSRKSYFRRAKLVSPFLVPKRRRP